MGMTPTYEETMSEHDKPAATPPRAPAAAPSQDSRLPGSPGGDPVAAAEAHLAKIDMAAQREALKRLHRKL